MHSPFNTPQNSRNNPHHAEKYYAWIMVGRPNVIRTADDITTIIYFILGSHRLSLAPGHVRRPGEHHTVLAGVEHHLRYHVHYLLSDTLETLSIC